MDKTRVTVSHKPSEQIKADLVVFIAFQDENKKPVADPLIADTVENAVALKDFEAKRAEQFIWYPGNREKSIQASRIMIVGLGRIQKQTDIAERNEILRKTGGLIAKACAKKKVKTLCICLPRIEGLPDFETAGCLTEGVLLGDYRFEKYKAKPVEKEEYKGIKTVIFSGSLNHKKVRSVVKTAVFAAQAVCEARNMANEPGNGWTSQEFALYAADLAEKYNLLYTCIEKEQMMKLGMGGILAVNQGSKIPPRMVILDYHPPETSDTILLVGKGITFDSGGISLKPASGMEEMKYDMCGGAAVMATMKAVGQQKPNVRVVAIVPATDNMSGSNAVRPGDIIRHFNGVTSEIVNTDAEGRMILGDALAYGIKTYAPDCVIDIATLTGSVIMGLGHHYSGLISNNDALSEKLTAAGDASGEPIWRLPLNKAYKKQIKSKVADIKNIGGRPAGAITAGAYLSKFVEEVPWAHLDIAGTAWDFTEKSYIPKGPSGIGVRTFLTLIRSWENGALKK